MLFKNINFLLGQRGAQLLSAQSFLKLNPEQLWDIVRQLGVPFEQLNTVDLAQRDVLIRNLDIRLLVLDVDGVLTDGGLYYTSSHDELKKFNVKDGMAITRMIAKGLQVGIISASLRAEVVRHRAELLGIQHVYVGKQPKEEVLESWLYTMGLSFEQSAYIGDDVNDVNLLRKCGLSAVPADGSKEAKQAAKIILQSEGGRGCVRELADNYLSRFLA